MSIVQGQAVSRHVPSISKQRQLFGEISHGITPFKVVSILNAADRGHPQQYYKLMEEIIEKDDNIHHAYNARMRDIEETSDFQLIPKNPKDEFSKRVAEAVSSFLKSIKGDVTKGISSFDGFRAGLSRAKIYGISPYAIVGNISKNKSLGENGSITGFQSVPPKNFTLKDSLFPKLVTQDCSTGMELNKSRWIIGVSNTHTNDLTRAGSRALIYLYMMRSMTKGQLMRYMEKFGDPLIIAKSKSKLDDQELKKISQAIYNLSNDGGMVAEGEIEIDYVQGSLDGSTMYNKFIERAGVMIDRIILGQTSTSSAENSNRSVADVHYNVRMDILRADLRAIEQTINEQLIPLIVSFMFSDPKAQDHLPQFRHKLKELLNIDTLAKIADTATANELMDDDLKETLRTKLKEMAS